jgi:hypothetical protein
MSDALTVGVRMFGPSVDDHILSSVISCDLSESFWSVKKFPFTDLESLFEMAFSGETGDKEMVCSSLSSGGL